VARPPRIGGGRPSLEGGKPPFEERSSSSRSCPRPPKQLPAITPLDFETFTARSTSLGSRDALSAREDMGSRGSDSTSARVSLRHRRHHHVRDAGGGSAPPTRGSMETNPGTPLFVHAPPMTEPSRRRIDSPFRDINSPSLFVETLEGSRIGMHYAEHVVPHAPEEPSRRQGSKGARRHGRPSRPSSRDAASMAGPIAVHVSQPCLPRPPPAKEVNGGPATDPQALQHFHRRRMPSNDAVEPTSSASSPVKRAPARGRRRPSEHFERGSPSRSRSADNSATSETSPSTSPAKSRCSPGATPGYDSPGGVVAGLMESRSLGSPSLASRSICSPTMETSSASESTSPPKGRGDHGGVASHVAPPYSARPILDSYSDQPVTPGQAISMEALHASVRGDGLLLRHEADGNLEDARQSPREIRATPQGADASLPLSSGSSTFKNIPLNNNWDDMEDANPFPESHSQSRESETSRHLNGLLMCTRGPRGSVKKLSMSIGGASGSGDKGHHLPMAAFSAGAAMMFGASKLELQGTMCSPTAMRGAKFSWVRGEVIGSGSLGSVFQALDQRTGMILAIKEVLIDEKIESDNKFKEALENEINIYKDLKHDHIVAYLGHDYINMHLFIYLEYMPGGSMKQVLCKFGPLDESLMAVYARDILDGLRYLHTRETPVLHRDVKGANILVDLDCRVKLSDFGCSKRTTDTMAHSMKGSLPWMAPEVIMNDGYGRKADIWSFGCVVVEMATAKAPWGAFDNNMQAMRKIGMSKETPPIPEELSVPCQNFICRCVQRDKQLRPTAADLLDDDFVREAYPENQ